MKLLIQRVNSAYVLVKNQTVGIINHGLLVFVGFTHTDIQETVDKLTAKLLQLRIFPDTNDKMNLSIQDIKGEILIVSQFTLYGDCQKGNRPSFVNAANPKEAEKLYNYFVKKCKESNLNIATGEFGAYMQVNL
ncbi:D-tyrosyl-tRNA(Tyr) deacylase, partial [Candidatus Beckwithbacteria bacterium CG23_combo_of_CG06-09_8_20_14_all_34_8]